MNDQRSPWIALIQGIGPTTHKKMSMQQLREASVQAGLDEVRTVLATGNLLFSSAADAANLKDQLAGILRSHDLANPVFLRQPHELEAVLENNPFPDAATERPSHLLVQFLDDDVEADNLAALRAYEGPERIAASGRELFLDYVDGVGDSKLTPALLTRRLGQPGTARNWNTIQKLLTAARK